MDYSKKIRATIFAAAAAMGVSTTEATEKNAPRPPKEVPLAIPSPIGYAGLIAENARLIGERYFAVDTSPFTRYEDLWIINHSALKQFQNQESVNKLTALAKGDVEEDVRRISALMLGRIA